MLPAPHPCGGAAAPAGWLSPSGITKSAPVPRFRRPKHSSFCRVIVAARARSTSLQLPILDCRLYFTGQHRKNQYFFAGPYNFFAAARVFAPTGECSARSGAFLSLHPPLLALVGAGVPDGPLLVLLPKGYFALRRDSLLPTAAKGCKNAAKNQWFLEFLSSDHSHAAKRPTPNRSCPYPRCRFHVPQENAVSYRRGTVYLRVVRRSGSDKRTARDSLYDDVRQFKSRVVRGGGFQRTPAAQEVLKPAVSSSVFGHFWGCGQK